jgi:pimeloyl-ACP methyl ester carboxylesterase
MDDVKHDEVSTFVSAIEAQAERRATPSGDGEMVWRIFGDGPPVVLLHGGHGSWTHWIRNIPVLAKRYRLYVADLPGYGDSAPAPSPFTAESLAAVVSRGLDIVLPPPASYALVGFSFGGIIGGATSVLQGARVHTFVSIGSSGLGLPPLGITGLRKWSADMPEQELREINRNNLSVIMIADPSRIDEMALRLQMANTMKAKIKGSSIARSDALRRALPGIKARMVCLAGSEDVYVKTNLAERKRIFRAVQPDTPFPIIEGAGHWVMYEAVDAFNTEISRIIDAGNATA